MTCRTSATLKISCERAAMLPLSISRPTKLYTLSLRVATATTALHNHTLCQSWEATSLPLHLYRHTVIALSHVCIGSRQYNPALDAQIDMYMLVSCFHFHPTGFHYNRIHKGMYSNGLTHACSPQNSTSREVRHLSEQLRGHDNTVMHPCNYKSAHVQKAEVTQC